ncbi:MAG: DNA-binding protein [Deltaproteobacteria bacterium]|nr:DNA-binding protein [Deltaproteobacteria bacterium]
MTLKPQPALFADVRMNKDVALVPLERIERSILLIRGQKVMLDRDLAQLYGVETRALNQAVRRNIDRFPADFMFHLTREEILRISQFVTSSGHPGVRTLKFSKNVMVFTEHGVAMLSSVLNSSRAVQVNIQIMRTFAKLREIISQHKDLARRLDELEKKYDAQFKIVFDAIRQLMASPEPKKRPIGFLVEEPRVAYGTSKGSKKGRKG